MSFMCVKPAVHMLAQPEEVSNAHALDQLRNLMSMNTEALKNVFAPYMLYKQ